MPSHGPPEKHVVTLESVRMDKSAFSVISLHEADADLKAYWHARPRATSN